MKNLEYVRAIIYVIFLSSDELNSNICDTFELYKYITKNICIILRRFMTKTGILCSKIFTFVVLSIFINLIYWMWLR